MENFVYQERNPYYLPPPIQFVAQNSLPAAPKPMGLGALVAQHRNPNGSKTIDILFRHDPEAMGNLLNVFNRRIDARLRQQQFDHQVFMRQSELLRATSTYLKYHRLQTELHYLFKSHQNTLDRLEKLQQTIAQGRSQMEEEKNPIQASLIRLSVGFCEIRKSITQMLLHQYNKHIDDTSAELFMLKKATA